MASVERSRTGEADLVMTALGSDVRRAILHLLAERERSAGEIAAHFPISRPAISKHLRLLSEAGLIASKTAGVRNIYRLHRSGFEVGRYWLDTFWPEALGRFKLLAENTYRAEDDG